MTERKRRKEQDEYTPIKLPNRFIEQIDKIMEKNPEYDFKTRPQFLRYLVRKYIDDHKLVESDYRIRRKD